MVTIGICEDEAWFADDLRRKTEEYLKERGLAGLVRVFARGEELLKYYEKPDIVLMDIKLPGQSGMKLAGSMRNSGSESQIIFVTSYQEYVFQAFDMDAVHYLWPSGFYSHLHRGLLLFRYPGRSGGDTGPPLLPLPQKLSGQYGPCDG